MSHHPWGSPSAESGRRSRSLTSIGERIFGGSVVDMDAKQDGRVSEGRVPFSAGSGVLFLPAVRRTDGRIKRDISSCISSSIEKGFRHVTVDEGNQQNSTECKGWLVVRLPPPSPSRVNTHAGGITWSVVSPPVQPLLSAQEFDSTVSSHGDHINMHRVYGNGEYIDLDLRVERMSPLHILFDNRFSVQMDLQLLCDQTLLVSPGPNSTLRVTVSSAGPYSLPFIQIQIRTNMQNTLYKCQWTLSSRNNLPPFGNMDGEDIGILESGEDWVAVRMVRVLDAT